MIHEHRLDSQNEQDPQNSRLVCKLEKSMYSESVMPDNSDKHLK